MRRVRGADDTGMAGRLRVNGPRTGARRRSPMRSLKVRSSPSRHGSARRHPCTLTARERYAFLLAPPRPPLGCSAPIDPRLRSVWHERVPDHRPPAAYFAAALAFALGGCAPAAHATLDHPVDARMSTMKDPEVVQAVQAYLAVLKLNEKELPVG